MQHSRDLHDLLLGLGADPTTGLPISDGMFCVYKLDDLTLALPNRSTVDVQLYIQTSAFAGEAGAIEICSPRGFYLKRLVNSTHNMNWGLYPQAGTVVTRPQIGCVAGAMSIPEGYKRAASSTNIATAYGPELGGPSSGVTLFNQMFAGTTTAALFSAVFDPAGRDAVIAGSPLWVPANVSLGVVATTVNAVTGFRLEIGLTAESLQALA